MYILFPYNVNAFLTRMTNKCVFLDYKMIRRLINTKYWYSVFYEYSVLLELVKAFKRTNSMFDCITLKRNIECLKRSTTSKRKRRLSIPSHTTALLRLLLSLFNNSVQYIYIQVSVYWIPGLIFVGLPYSNTMCDVIQNQNECSVVVV